jgi:hypothetical protein
MTNCCTFLKFGSGWPGVCLNTFAGTVHDLTARPRADRSASFYENGIKRYDKLLHVSEVW